MKFRVTVEYLQYFHTTGAFGDENRDIRECKDTYPVEAASPEESKKRILEIFENNNLLKFESIMVEEGRDGI